MGEAEGNPSKTEMTAGSLGGYHSTDQIDSLTPGAFWSYVAWKRVRQQHQDLSEGLGLPEAPRSFPWAPGFNPLYANPTTNHSAERRSSRYERRRATKAMRVLRRV